MLSHQMFEFLIYKDLGSLRFLYGSALCCGSFLRAVVYCLAVPTFLLSVVVEIYYCSSHIFVLMSSVPPCLETASLLLSAFKDCSDNG